MIYDLQRSAHLRWLLDRRCYVHLRWSCFLLLFDMSTTNITFCVDHKAKLQTTQVQKVWKFHWPTEDGKSLLGKKVISPFTVIAQDITNPTISRNTWNNIISRDRPVEESGTSVSRNYHIKCIKWSDFPGEEMVLDQHILHALTHLRVILSTNSYNIQWRCQRI